MEQFLTHRRVLLKDLKTFVLQQATRLKAHAAAAAEHAGRPYEYLASLVRKDQRARAIAARDRVTEGLICVFSTVEPCRTFRLAYGHGRPAIARRGASACSCTSTFSTASSASATSACRPGFRSRSRSTSTATSGSPGRWTSAAWGTVGSRMPSCGSFHVRGLVAKIPRSRRWCVTQFGHAVMSAAIQLREEDFPGAFLNAAA
jgi:hypothetical protein